MLIVGSIWVGWRTENNYSKKKALKKRITDVVGCAWMTENAVYWGADEAIIL